MKLLEKKTHGLIFKMLLDGFEPFSSDQSKNVEFDDSFLI
jgi:hypothetical protein